jgi:hypothetical protein
MISQPSRLGRDAKLRSFDRSTSCAVAGEEMTTVSSVDLSQAQHRAVLLCQVAEGGCEVSRWWMLPTKGRPHGPGGRRGFFWGSALDARIISSEMMRPRKAVVGVFIAPSP